MKKKYCAGCATEKAERAFAKARFSKDGLQAWCRACYKKYREERNPPKKKDPKGWHTCPNCKTLKLLGEFLKSNTKSGVGGRCRECRGLLPLPPEGHKRCSKCKRIKVLDEFYSNRGQKDGKSCACKACEYYPSPNKNYSKYVEPERKRCSDCGVTKDITEFTRRAKGGLYKSHCKPCGVKRTEDWVERNREKHNEYQRQYSKRLYQKRKVDA